jgi:hypothetical protein
VLVVGCVVAALLSIPAMAGASTKGFVVRNDSGYTLKLTAVDPYGGICRTQRALRAAVQRMALR